MTTWEPDPIRANVQVLARGPFQSHPCVAGRILKLKPTAINEAAGYQFAAQLDIPTAKLAMFVLEAPIEYRGYRFRTGDVGLLLEKLDPIATVGEPWLAGPEPVLAAKIITLWTFDRHEWGEIWQLPDRFVVIDLEFLFARYVTGRDHRAKDLREYVEMTRPMFRETLELARKADVEEQFRDVLKTVIRRAIDGTFIFDLKRHRWGETIEQHLLRSLRLRAENLARLL